ncbi:MAG: hypothetical protein JWM96_616, partial [Alphaproteobacteria bacterium]|nr:hypothetical protein [Alphaproteobacteria bacterium]
IDGISLKDRGRVREKSFSIGKTSVQFVLGDIAQARFCQAVIVPHFPHKASIRSVAGTFIRSDYQNDIDDFAKEMENNNQPLGYGTVHPRKRTYGKELTNLGTPDYFFHAITVVQENNSQFNAVRMATEQAGLAAVGLSDDEHEINKIVLPALGTGVQGHLKGYQSARAIYAGINDFTNRVSPKNAEKVSFHIYIKDDAMHAPIMDEFLAVMKDVSYLNVPKEGEIGKKQINTDKILDHIRTENALTEAYNLSKAYQSDYARYDL